METLPTWREREARFRALPDPGKQLHAVLMETTAAEHLERLATALVTARQTPGYPLDAADSLAQRITDVAGVSAPGKYGCRWIVSADSRDPHAARILTTQFRDQAACAARAADLVAVGATDDEAVDRWLDFLKDSQSPYYRGDDFPVIDNLTAASADMCVPLATRAYEAQRASSVTASGQPPIRTLDVPAPASSDDATLLKKTPAGASTDPERSGRHHTGSSNDSGEQSRAKARHAFVDRQLARLNLSILEWAQQSVPPVAYTTVRQYMDGKTRHLHRNTRTLLAQTLGVPADDLPE